MFKKPNRNVTKNQKKRNRKFWNALWLIYDIHSTIYALTFNAAFCQNASGQAINKNALPITIKTVFSVSIVLWLCVCFFIQEEVNWTFYFGAGFGCIFSDFDVHLISDLTQFSFLFPPRLLLLLSLFAFYFLFNCCRIKSIDDNKTLV